MSLGRRSIGFRLRLVGGIFVCALLLAGAALRVFAQGNVPLQGQAIIPDKTKFAPSFQLQDQFGRKIGPRQFHDRVVVMAFLDSHCVKDCPVIGKELSYVEKKLGPSVPWTLLVVSVAPFTDSPSSSVAFAMKSGWTGDWHWLFGSPTDLAKVWKDYGIWVKPTSTEIMHTAAVYVIGPDQYMRVADIVPFVPDDLVKSIRALSPATSHGGWFGWLSHISL
jgi:cytochrome oxidase Cu insertion factor (SCO1/SenC/PrrC family)